MFEKIKELFNNTQDAQKNKEEASEEQQSINIENKISQEMIEKASEKLKEITQKEVVKIKVVGLNEDLTLTQSKFGGLPYLPQDKEVPVDENNIQLLHLAQINCAELPENNIYPQNGILQFWIGRDDIYGMDFDSGTNNNGFRVIYYSEIDESITKEQVANKYIYPNFKEKEEYSIFEPENATFELKFEKITEHICYSDYNFESKFKEIFNEFYPENKIADDKELYEVLDNENYNKLLEIFTNIGHKIGGYPFFTQWDPRGNDKYSAYNILLLQIDSDFVRGSWEIIWGDSGVGNFFITEEQLAALDFSKILFNWDCY